MSELKPCPFCGGEAYTYNLHDWWVSHDCYAVQRVVSTHTFSTEAEAIEAWNTRHERTCEMEQSFIEPSRLDFMQEYRCSECGEYGYMQIACDGDGLKYCPNCGAKVVGI